MKRAIGISVHTGWGACVVVGGSLAKPEIVANEVIEILGFYRDVLREACAIPARVVRPSALDPTKVGKLAAAPWGRDQKLAALAAWTVIGG